MYGSIAASWCDIVRGRRMPPYSAYAGDRIVGGFCGKYWEGLGRFGCIAAHYSNIVRGCKTPQNRNGIVCMRAGITRRVAGRSGASTGCSGLCPLPIPTHTFPYSPIIYRAAHPASLHYAATSRRSPLSCTMLAAYASVGVGGWLPLYFSNSFNILLLNRVNLFCEKPFCRSTTLLDNCNSPLTVATFIYSLYTSMRFMHSFSSISYIS